MEASQTSEAGFEFIVLGASGGPIEAFTSCYLVKPPYMSMVDVVAAPEKNALLSIDAGTGLAGLNRIIAGDMKANPFRELLDSSTVDTYTHASSIFNSISTYLITHPHLDHVTSLVVNTPGIISPKTVVGLENTTTALVRNLFNDIVWPNMVKAGLIKISTLADYEICDVNQYYTAKAFPVSHGTNYISTAYVITDKMSHKSMVSFGDVESDLTSGLSLNRRVWEHIAPLIRERSLRSIVIECSTLDRPPPLFGHMTPTTIFEEILTLRKLVYGKEADESELCGLSHQPLDGMTVVIIHVKESTEGDPRPRILSQLNELNYKFNTKVNFHMARPGDCLPL